MLYCYSDYYSFLLGKCIYWGAKLHILIKKYAGKMDNLQIISIFALRYRENTLIRSI